MIAYAATPVERDLTNPIATQLWVAVWVTTPDDTTALLAEAYDTMTTVDSLTLMSPAGAWTIYGVVVEDRASENVFRLRFNGTEKIS